MNPNALRVPSLVLALSLLPDAVRAGFCEKVLDKMFDSVARTAWRIGHHAGAPMNLRRYRTKRALLSHLQSIRGSWGFRILRGDGVSEAEYDKGLDTLDQALQHAEVRFSLAGLQDIEITNEREVRVREFLFGSSVRAYVPHDAPRATLERNLASKLLEFDLDKRLQGNLLFHKGGGVSHGGYVDALRRFRSSLGASRVPEEFRKISFIYVTDRENIHANFVKWSTEDRLLEQIKLTVPPGSMDAGLIANAVLEAEAGEMLGELGFTAMAWGERSWGIPSTVANGGVDEADYEGALRRFVGELRRRDPTDRSQRGGPGAGAGPPLDRVARFVVTPPGGKILPKPMKDAPGFLDLHVPMDRLSLENAFEAVRLLPAVSD